MQTKRYRHLRVRAEGDTTVVGFEGAALGEGNAAEVGDELLDLVPGLLRPRLRLDLRGVTYLTSTGLGKLLVLLKRVRAAGGRLTVENAEPEVYEIFQVTRLVPVLDVRPGEPAAGAEAR